VTRLFMIAWADDRDRMERDGWTLVQIYAVMGCHHAPCALFVRNE